jgi:hypothetical protein
MLMCDENRVDVCEIFAYRRQPLAKLEHTDAGVDQDTRAVRGEQGRVSAAAARQSAKLDDRNSPLTL